MSTHTTKPEHLLGNIQTVITGLQYTEARAEAGEAVHLEREPENRHDAKAVRVDNANGAHCGYLPRRIVTWLTPLLDAGYVWAGARADDMLRQPPPRQALDLTLYLHPKGAHLLEPSPDPKTIGEALHRTVAEAYRAMDAWSQPNVVRELEKRFRKLPSDDLLPETRMLVALFESKAREVATRTSSASTERVRQSMARVEIGSPVHFRNLTLFPLIAPNGHSPLYRLLEEATSEGTAHIEEISEGGSVPQIRLRNLGDMPLLIPEGEILSGAKQNRVVNMTVLAPAKQDIVIPVSCVERGRWHHISRAFRPTHFAPPRMRGKKNASMFARRERAAARFSDQGEVWADVDESLAAANVASPTDSLTEGYEATRTSRQAYHENLRMPDKACGVITASGSQIIGIELFDSPTTFQKLWARLSDAYFFEAAFRPGTNDATTQKTAERFIKSLPEDLKRVDDPIGLGEEFRIHSRDMAGSAIYYRDQICHLAAFTLDTVK